MPFRCNKCWKPTERTGNAYITTCSHIFCSQCGDPLFAGGGTAECPACHRILAGRDVQLMELSPGEAFQRMACWGLEPETILEMVNNALEFYAYQKQNEVVYASFLSKKVESKATQQERVYSDKMVEGQNSVNTLNRQIDTLRQDLAAIKQESQELQSQVSEKERQYAKLESGYEALRLKYGGHEVSSLPLSSPAPTQPLSRHRDVLRLIPPPSGSSLGTLPPVPTSTSSTRFPGTPTPARAFSSSLFATLKRPDTPHLLNRVVRKGGL
ncbi:putative E3 ubiquitin-protein ligase CCNB1IP1 [Paratrimastix pyriformis]|uniref:E3 ubiquitin-protein ligase CCNB1IP1 n=1 Tax=Paratrimastix pyriformis TaxID=342808 RepID=A0ABQ8UB79_9EUKA|nr:putative E3 ubiquitin-protein ligase CCNB1IP1 [Paratrimastix pyriformis]